MHIRCRRSPRIAGAPFLGRFLIRTIPVVALSVVSGGAIASPRTFVSPKGLDTQPCSLVQPCRSFTGAMAKTDSGGEVIVLDAAGYGPVTITKSISIIAPPGIYAGITVVAGNDGVTVDAFGATVVLRGLSINGSGGGNGILVQQAARVRIENCVISKMGAAGIAHTADFAAELIVLDSIVRDNGGDGIDVQGVEASAVLERVRSEHNQGHGLRVAASGVIPPFATVIESVFAHNGANGILADTGTAATKTRIVVERSVIAHNGQNGFIATDAVATLSRNAIQFNQDNGVWIYNQWATLVDNVVNDNAGAGIFSDQGFVYFSGNVATTNNPSLGNVLCYGSAPQFVSAGDNVVYWIAAIPPCYVTQSRT